jgi:NAD(P)-dependent dehydrogenase (short-subunit alcohol dehydrogenase family)
MKTVKVERKNLFKLEGKTIVVTGGTGLLGSAYCKVLASQGANIVIADINEAACANLALELEKLYQVRALGVACNVNNESEVNALFSESLAAFGKVDSIVNNAAATGEHLMKVGSAFEDFENYPLDLWNEVIKTNLTGVFLVAREGGKAMLSNNEGGSLINVSSTYGIVGPDHRIYEGMEFKSFAPYSASKAGVHGLTRWLATYWGSVGIRVNTLVPGGVENGHDPEFVRRYIDRTPLRRMAKSEDYLGIIVYLASDMSKYATGQQFIVDGGWTAV